MKILLKRIRTKIPALGAAIAIACLVFFASADDPNTDIPICCPDFVLAGTPITGFVCDYSPTVTISAVKNGGMPMPGSPFTGFGSITFFCYPTHWDVRGPVCISAIDSHGQTGVKVVLVI